MTFKIRRNGLTVVKKVCKMGQTVHAKYPKYDNEQFQIWKLDYIILRNSAGYGESLLLHTYQNSCAISYVTYSQDLILLL